MNLLKISSKCVEVSRSHALTLLALSNIDEDS